MKLFAGSLGLFGALSAVEYLFSLALQEVAAPSRPEPFAVVELAIPAGLVPGNSSVIAYVQNNETNRILGAANVAF